MFCCRKLQFFSFLLDEVRVVDRRGLITSVLVLLSTSLFFRESLYYSSLFLTKNIVPCLVAFLAMALIVGKLVPKLLDLREKTLKFVPLGASLVIVSFAGLGFRESNLVFPDVHPQRAELELYDWAKRETSLDSIFLTPVNMRDFRLWAERGVIVDWKSMPLHPDGVLEWYRRHAVISGKKEWKSLQELKQGYKEIDSQHLEMIQSKYPFSYFVDTIDGAKSDEFSGYSMVFENGKYRVWRR